MADVKWDIRREGRRWHGPESRARYQLSPEKIEWIEGQLFCTEEERLAMLGLLLKNVGIDKAIRLGPPALWREAIAQLDNER